MVRGLRRQAPALTVCVLALVAALGGTVYAAGRINGHVVKVKSLPGNRLALGSVPGNRLRRGAVTGDKLAPGSITGIQIDVSTLGEVPTAIHAETAESARDAETALSALSAETAKKVNGYEAGCDSSTRPFAGACWQTLASEAALNAPAAALACASQGGELPDALALIAFSQQPGIALANGDEWTGEIPVVTSEDVYSVVTVTTSAIVKTASSTATRKFRCVLPLVR
jgi:hypothetical protein